MPCKSPPIRRQVRRFLQHGLSAIFTFCWAGSGSANERVGDVNKFQPPPANVRTCNRKEWQKIQEQSRAFHKVADPTATGMQRWNRSQQANRDLFSFERECIAICSSINPVMPSGFGWKLINERRWQCKDYWVRLAARYGERIAFDKVRTHRHGGPIQRGTSFRKFTVRCNTMEAWLPHKEIWIPLQGGASIWDTGADLFC